MNIMKTNMLLLDNRIRKDDGDNTATVAVETPSAAQSKIGMNALMFQGMQNLMANPALAREVGMMNENVAAKDAVSSNVAFQGKAKTLALGALIALSSAAGLTSCDDKEYISVPASEYVNNVTVNVDLSAISAMLNAWQSTFTQYMMQQQMNFEEYKKFMEKTEAWQKMIQELLAGGFNNLSGDLSEIKAMLADMGDELFMIDNHIVQGFDENNKQHLALIDALSKQMTREDAIAFFNKLCAEIAKVAAAENATDADIQAAIAKAMEQILEQFKLVNANLSNIADKLDQTNTLLKDNYDVLKDIKGDTRAMRYAVETISNQIDALHTTVIETGDRFVASIEHLEGVVQAKVDYIAQTVGWSTAQVIAFMNKLGIDIRNAEAWSASMVIAAINNQTQYIKQLKEEIAKLRADFNEGRMTAEEYAQAILAVVNDMNAKLGVLIEDFNSYADDMRNFAETGLKELRFGNMTAIQANGLLANIWKLDQKAYAMLKLMNQNIEQIDVDMNAGIDALAAKLGCSTAQIVGMLQWLGYTEAQISTMNAGAIINAIKNLGDNLGDKLDELKASVENINIDMNAGIDALSAKIGCSTAQIVSVLKWLGYTEAQISTMNAGAIINAIKNATNKTINVLGDKIEALMNKIGTGDNNLTQEEKEALMALLQGIYQEVQNNGKTLDEIKELIKDLMADLEAYAQAALNAHNDEMGLLAKIASEIQNLGYKLNVLINYAKQVTEKQDITNEKIDGLKLQINQIIAKIGHPITPQELDELLDKYTKELLAKLNIKPADFSTIEELLADIDAKMEYQARTNVILNDIFNLLKNAKELPDYNAKLDKIIELMENFKFECNCKCDCDNNDAIHEGIIDILS